MSDDDQSVRDWLKDLIVPLLPSDWTFIPNQRVPETIDRTTVVLTHSEIEPLREAPTSQLSSSVTLTVVSKLQDQPKAENALDNHVLVLCTALDTICRTTGRLTWTSAKKSAVRDPYIGWDITLTVISEKKKEV